MNVRNHDARSGWRVGSTSRHQSKSPAHHTTRSLAELNGVETGAYCIENELILLRRMHFPDGVAPGDVVALVNTGGYLMHILESASHQIPLARNVVRTTAGFVVDAIDTARP